MKTKELELPEEWMEKEWKSNKVKIKILSGREAYGIRDEASNLKITDGGIKGEFSQEAALIGTVAKFVTEAPWKVNDRTTVANLPEPILNWLQEEYAEMRTFPEKKKDNSSK